MPVLVKYIVTCGSNSRHMNFQRHSADDPAKLEGEVTVTPVSCVCVCVFVCVCVCWLVLVVIAQTDQKINIFSFSMIPLFTKQHIF